MKLTCTKRNDYYLGLGLIGLGFRHRIDSKIFMSEQTISPEYYTIANSKLECSLVMR